MPLELASQQTACILLLCPSTVASACMEPYSLYAASHSTQARS